MTKVPSDPEIRGALQTLFEATAHLDRATRWNALFPTEAEPPVPLPRGKKWVNYFPQKEFEELLDFVRYFGGLINSHSQAEPNTVRIMLMAYCHIMESEFMPTLIWNQLRLILGEQPSWRFTRLTTTGNIEVCRYPTQKFQEIQRLAQQVDQQVGDVVNRIWDGQLRNAFSHSRYWLSPTSFILSAGMSPISRTGPLGSCNSPSHSFDQIRERYRAAKSLLRGVRHEYARARKVFR